MEGAVTIWPVALRRNAMDFPGQADPALHKERLMTSGRDSAAYIARVMPNLRLPPAERDELCVCRERLEQYVKVLAGTENTNGKEIGALGYRMAEVLAECVGIISRFQDRRPLGQ